MQAGVSTILRDSPQAGREILQALKGNRILAMLIDQDTKVRGVMVDFFGRKANTAAGAAILARRLSVPVIAGFIHRTEDGCHRIKIYPPIEMTNTGDYRKDIEENTQKYTQIIEKHIKEFPEDWVWIHRRWRRHTPYLPVVPKENETA
jgi:KDO2-lipid IV(A) lauroyltransferase